MRPRLRKGRVNTFWHGANTRHLQPVSRRLFHRRDSNERVDTASLVVLDTIDGRAFVTLLLHLGMLRHAATACA